MSNYKRVTRHPLNGDYSIAEWKDDYFGPHRYGVLFENTDDPVVYPDEQVRAKQLKEFWAADVMEAVMGLDGADHKMLLTFLDNLNKEYKARWERDPVGGEGAVKHFRYVRGQDERSNQDTNTV